LHVSLSRAFVDGEYPTESHMYTLYQNLKISRQYVSKSVSCGGVPREPRSFDRIYGSFDRVYGSLDRSYGCVEENTYIVLNSLLYAYTPTLSRSPDLSLCLFRARVRHRVSIALAVSFALARKKRAIFFSSTSPYHVLSVSLYHVLSVALYNVLSVARASARVHMYFQSLYIMYFQSLARARACICIYIRIYTPHRMP